MTKNKEGSRWGIAGTFGVVGVLALAALANSNFLGATQTQTQTAAAMNSVATNSNNQAAFTPSPKATSTTKINASKQKHVVAPQSSGNDLSNNKTYTNVSGHSVHAPAYDLDADIPAGASARCRDGTYSFSEHHRGTCSHHGGVSEWL